jgi:hypothetical protein
MFIQADPQKRSRLLWGMLLVWIPFLLLMAPSVIRISRLPANVGATGLSTAAALLSEGLLYFSCAGAIVLLAHLFSKGHLLPGIPRPLLICLIFFMAAVMGGCLLLFAPHFATNARVVAFAIFGCATVIAFELAGVLLLSGAFSTSRATRRGWPVLSVCCSGLILTTLGAYVWALGAYIPQVTEFAARTRGVH